MAAKEEKQKRIKKRSTQVKYCSPPRFASPGQAAVASYLADTCSSFYSLTMCVSMGIELRFRSRLASPPVAHLTT